MALLDGLAPSDEATTTTASFSDSFLVRETDADTCMPKEEGFDLVEQLVVVAATDPQQQKRISGSSSKASKNSKSIKERSPSQSQTLISEDNLTFEAMLTGVEQQDINGATAGQDNNTAVGGDSKTRSHSKGGRSRKHNNNNKGRHSNRGTRTTTTKLGEDMDAPPLLVPMPMPAGKEVGEAGMLGSDSNQDDEIITTPPPKQQQKRKKRESRSKKKQVSLSAEHIATKRTRSSSRDRKPRRSRSKTPPSTWGSRTTPGAGATTSDATSGLDASSGDSLNQSKLSKTPPSTRGLRTTPFAGVAVERDIPTGKAPRRNSASASTFTASPNKMVRTAITMDPLSLSNHNQRRRRSMDISNKSGRGVGVASIVGAVVEVEADHPISSFGGTTGMETSSMTLSTKRASSRGRDCGGGGAAAAAAVVVEKVESNPRSATLCNQLVMDISTTSTKRASSRRRSKGVDKADSCVGDVEDHTISPTMDTSTTSTKKSASSRRRLGSMDKSTNGAAKSPSRRSLVGIDRSSNTTTSPSRRSVGMKNARPVTSSRTTMTMPTIPTSMDQSGKSHNDSSMDSSNKGRRVSSGSGMDSSKGRRSSSRSRRRPSSLGGNRMSSSATDHHGRRSGSSALMEDISLTATVTAADSMMQQRTRRMSHHHQRHRGSSGSSSRRMSGSAAAAVSSQSEVWCSSRRRHSDNPPREHSISTAAVTAVPMAHPGRARRRMSETAAAAPAPVAHMGRSHTFDEKRAKSGAPQKRRVSLSAFAATTVDVGGAIVDAAASTSASSGDAPLPPLGRSRTIGNSSSANHRPALAQRRASISAFATTSALEHPSLRPVKSISKNRMERYERKRAMINTPSRNWMEEEHEQEDEEKTEHTHTTADLSTSSAGKPTRRISDNSNKNENSQPSWCRKWAVVEDFQNPFAFNNDNTGVANSTSSAIKRSSGSGSRLSGSIHRSNPFNGRHTSRSSGIDAKNHVTAPNKLPTYAKRKQQLYDDDEIDDDTVTALEDGEEDHLNKGNGRNFDMKYININTTTERNQDDDEHGVVLAKATSKRPVRARDLRQAVSSSPASSKSTRSMAQPTTTAKRMPLKKLASVSDRMKF